MGNCIGSESAFSHNEKKVSLEQGDKEFKAAKIVSTLPLAEILKSGEVYGLIPQPMEQFDCNGQRVKIVVTKKQLQLLIKSSEELKSRLIVLQSIRKKVKKWRPSLATIPEL